LAPRIIPIIRNRITLPCGHENMTCKTILRRPLGQRRQLSFPPRRQSAHRVIKYGLFLIVRRMTRPAGAYGDFVIRNEAAATLTRPSNCCRRAEPRVQTLWHLRFVSRWERFGSSSVDPLQSLGSKAECRRIQSSYS